MDYFSDIDQWLPVTQNTYTHTFQKAGTFRVVQKLIGTSGCVIVTDSVWVSVAPGITSQDTTSIHLVDVQHPVVHINWKSHPAAVGYQLFSGNSLGNQSLLQQTSDTFYAHSVQQSLFYTVVAQDSCGNQSIAGNHGKPIGLQGKVRGNNVAAELSFSPYQVWPGNELSYNIQKQWQEDWLHIGSQFQHGEYEDEGFLVEGQLQSCYRIQGIDLADSELISHSNVICLPYIPLVFFPTAFSPNGDGLNDVFEVSMAGIKSSTMTIFNSWGEQIAFSTNGKWDGTYRGKPAPIGVYLIHLRYTTANGESFETKTGVHLVR